VDQPPDEKPYRHAPEKRGDLPRAHAEDVRRATPWMRPQRADTVWLRAGGGWQRVRG
jgi:hypothetical protein